MWEFLFDNPWIPLGIGGIVFVLFLDHWFKEKRREQIGKDLVKYRKQEHGQGRPVFYPNNLRGKRGEVRAASQDEAVDSFFKARTWPFWATLLVLALGAGLVLYVLKGIGVL